MLPSSDICFKICRSFRKNSSFVVSFTCAPATVASTTISFPSRSVGWVPACPAMPDPSTDPDGYERSHYLRQLIDTLDERDHSIVMAHLHGFSNIEIARMTGLTAAHVSVLLTRIKRKLRKLYEDEI